MQDETKFGERERKSRINETKAVRYANNLTEPKCEPRQMFTVKEDTGEDSYAIEEETRENWFCHATDLLSASSSTDGSANDVPSRDNLLPDEEKAIRYESNSTEPQCGPRQMFTVKEATGEDWLTVNKEYGGNWVCHATDLLSASSSTDGSGNDVPSRDILLPDEEKAIRYESNSTKPQCEPRQMFTVKEDTGEDWLTVNKEYGGNWVCYATDLLNSSSTANVSGTDVPPQDGQLCDEDKIPKQCMECGREFAFKIQFQRHIYEVHKRTRICEECGRSFSRPTEVSAHRRVVHEKNLYMCPFEGCDRPGFRHNRSLKVHIRSVHAHVRPHVCKTCGKGLSLRAV
ncbi:hypothetical protein KIN20_025460 [Parelaphostrongylus tenuis]|uniref:C2H2-type domain-containing protein n=1 Tax=Parelaphostrongylus tenuis TaxID=148309 RepID=A0AAD5MVB9_PARTN|nr:hypothetical protein KIN20_025460 [Parelaphostrongylus tenuis]